MCAQTPTYNLTRTCKPLLTPIHTVNKHKQGRHGGKFETVIDGPKVSTKIDSILELGENIRNISEEITLFVLFRLASSHTV